MFIITYPFTSSNYKRFYNKSIIIYDDVAKVYHKFDPSANTCLAFSTLEEATLAKLHLLNRLAALITSDIAYLQAKFAEACPPELSTAYDSMKLNYPEIFI